MCRFLVRPFSAAQLISLGEIRDSADFFFLLLLASRSGCTGRSLVSGERAAYFLEDANAGVLGPQRSEAAR